MKQIAGQDLLAAHFDQVPLFKGLALEGVANRNALPYAEKYGLGPVEHLTSLFRGTLRYVYECLKCHADVHQVQRVFGAP